jgi:hypothetical protein
VHREQKRLAALNVVGGSLVLGSYWLAFAGSPELKTGLWGGVPEALRPLYTVNMLLAAGGYFPFTALLLFATSPAAALPGGHRYRLLHLLYGLVLFPSALWLPLTARMLAEPSALLWAAIRVDLALVGLGSTGLLVLLFGIARRRRDAFGWVAFAGVLPFWLQTAVLDALVWPAYFPWP